MPVLDQRRVSTMVDFVLNDPSAVSRPFDLMDDKFHADASEDEFRTAFDLVVKLLREMIQLERMDRVTPKAEPVRRRRPAPPAPQPLPLFPQCPVTRPPGDGLRQSPTSNSLRGGTTKRRRGG